MMNDTAAFAGEIEFVDLTPPEKDFGEFENLPYSNDLHDLAEEYSNNIELMPYQKVGENIKLLISVYLKTKRTSRTIIAVLTRDTYPSDPSEFASMVKIARNRLERQSQLSHQFERASIDSAEAALDQLYQKLVDRWST